MRGNELKLGILLPENQGVEELLQMSLNISNLHSEIKNIKMNHKKLFCRACREEVSVEKSIVENHVKSSKHAKGKERMSKNEAQHKDLAGNTMMMFTSWRNTPANTASLSCKSAKIIFESRYTLE